MIDISCAPATKIKLYPHCWHEINSNHVNGKTILHSYSNIFFVGLSPKTKHSLQPMPKLYGAKCLFIECALLALRHIVECCTTLLAFIFRSSIFFYSLPKNWQWKMRCTDGWDWECWLQGKFVINITQQVAFNTSQFSL